jgi:hypothetical protein
MLPEIQTPNQAILYGQRYSTHQKDYIYMTVSIIKQYYMVNGTVHTRKIIYIYIYNRVNNQAILYGQWYSTTWGGGVPNLATNGLAHEIITHVILYFVGRNSSVH